MKSVLLVALYLLLVSISYAQHKAPQYSISVSITGEGSVIPDQTTASRGDTIHLTINPGPNQALLRIEARLAPSASGGLNILVKLISVDETHYYFVVTADTQVNATFVPQPIDSLGRMPYALYLADSTLFFVNTADALAVGDPIYGSTIVALWSGIEITYSSTISFTPEWNETVDVTDDECESLYPYRRVVFDESFSTVRPTTLCNWFSVYFEGGPESIEGLQYLNTSEVTTMFGMFWDCAAITEIDVSHFDTHKVTNMSYMFSGCSNLLTLDISQFDVGKVVQAGGMFYGCTSLEKILCDDTWNISKSSNMFSDCPKLHGAVAWDASAIKTTMANPVTGYFTYASGDLDADGSLTTLDVDLLVHLLLQGEEPTRVSDINHDSRLSLSDVTALVNRLK